jgi:hypothetical protein
MHSIQYGLYPTIAIYTKKIYSNSRKQEQAERRVLISRKNVLRKKIHIYLTPFCYCTILITYTMNLLCLELHLFQETWPSIGRKSFNDYNKVTQKGMHTATMISGELPIILISLTSTSDICKICTNHKDIFYLLIELEYTMHSI